MVKQVVNIPVFGNGDVFDREDCWRMILETNCDGVAIGRMAVARPWIFAEMTGNIQPGPEMFADAATQLAGLLEAHYDPVAAIKRFKRFAFYFSANFRFGHSLYTKILNTGQMKEVDSILKRFFEQSPDIAARPNLNYFS
jgi:tRNA-dihydrouridine synthase